MLCKVHRYHQSDAMLLKGNQRLVVRELDPDFSQQAHAGLVDLFDIRNETISEHASSLINH
jgi:hypothetical protein